MAGEFLVMNPLDVVDCIDMDASQAQLNPLDKTTIIGVKKLVLRDIPAELTLVRPSMWKSRSGLTGLVFDAPDKFKR